VTVEYLIKLNILCHFQSGSASDHFGDCVSHGLCLCVSIFLQCAMWQ